MTTARNPRIGQAFARAHDYDRHAKVQREVATGLAARIAELPLPAQPRIWEIGCGTGFLTEAMLNRGLDGQWLITDLAPAMVDRCRARIGPHPNRAFAVLDAEAETPEGDQRFDLICSSLAFQWFDDLASALPRLLARLAPGGHCLFTTLAAGTFAEWRAAHAAEGQFAGTPPFPTLAHLRAVHAAPQHRPAHFTLEVEHHLETHTTAREFLMALKAIGAGTAAPGHRPLDAPPLRRVMRRFEQAGARVSYEVVTCHYTADGRA